MESLRYAYEIIKTLERANVGSIYKNNDIFTIPKSEGATLVEVSDSQVVINGVSFNDRITPSKPSKLKERIPVDSFKSFITELSRASEVKLNHFGISYYCTSIELETANIKRLVDRGDLYEEASGVSSTKWLFIGNAKKPQEPLFELVLNQRSAPVLSSWVPHFQIDIDTTIPIEDLQDIINKHLGTDWVKWSITVDDWGVPLVMGRLCSIDGLKVYLGIGTNKRDRIWHREKGLKQL